MCSNVLKFGLQVELFLNINTAVKSKSISNSCKTNYLVILKSKYDTL